MKSVLFPEPKQWNLTGGTCRSAEFVPLCLPEQLAALIPALRTVCPLLSTQTGQEKTADGAEEVRKRIMAVRTPDKKTQEYELTVSAEGILLIYGELSGAFYGLVTLGQLLKEEEVPYCRIVDFPDLQNRGYMLDISRGKVPTLAALKQTADLLARFKYNQFQLYIEGFSYQYPEFSEYSDRSSALSPEELRELDTYCRERRIELVPNQNSLGHMTDWLALPEFRSLAEAKDGLKLSGISLPPTTLNAADPESLRFVTKLMDGLLPAFHSGQIHVGLDEAFELGRGINSGVDTKMLFSGYVTRLQQEVQARKKRMMMWGDSIYKMNGLLELLPEDITFMEWGYEKEYPYADHCRLYAETNRPFYVCPGTNSWFSLTGMTDNMLAAIRSAASAAAEYGACGILLTDWGDMDHLQYFSASYPAICYCAAKGWNTRKEPDEKTLALALERLCFGKGSKGFGTLVLEAGRYYEKEEYRLPCRTLASLLLSDGVRTKQQEEETVTRILKITSFLAPREVSSAYWDSFQAPKPSRLAELSAELDNLLEQLEAVTPAEPEGLLSMAEYRNTLKLVRLLTALRSSYLSGMPAGDHREELEEIISEHRHLWLLRNKESGLLRGIGRIRRLDGR